MASGFTLDTSKFKNPRELDTKIQRAMFAVCKKSDGAVEAWMKHNAPWNDRTTNARNGLAARAAKLFGSTYGIILSHGVDYGIYLERGTRYMKARPVILPAIRIWAPKVIALTEKLLDRLDAAAAGGA